MKKLVELAVKYAIRSNLYDDGLKNTIQLSYNDLDYGLDAIFIPKIKDDNDDDEYNDDDKYDRLREECESLAKSTFIEVRQQLRQAYALIQAALSLS